MDLNYKDNYCYGCNKWSDCIKYFSCDDALDCRKCSSFGCFEYKNNKPQKNIFEEDEIFD